MAFSVKDSHSDHEGELADINVTPFIDVVLVLLIIFMVAAPLSTVDVPVDLPASNAQPKPRTDEPVLLTVRQDLGLVLGNDPVDRAALGATLDGRTGANRDERIFLRADKGVSYGDLMEVMNAMRSAGYLKIALVGLESVSPAGAPPPAAPLTPAAP
ncbi:TonB system transport protein ExbD [Aureimonas psammosilenae]|uniref:TonB system transport protein ExbD n=1 Tax=Aureimonas psammosilenae TaxID=2495496 RepID=UPI0012611965|nr:TonB system transport protein ExbD [Aureimonas psammosilenae]